MPKSNNCVCLRIDYAIKISPDILKLVFHIFRIEIRESYTSLL